MRAVCSDNSLRDFLLDTISQNYKEAKQSGLEIVSRATDSLKVCLGILERMDKEELPDNTRQNINELCNRLNEFLELCREKSWQFEED